MSGHNAHDAPAQSRGHFPGILQSLIASIIGAACGPLSVWCWTRVLHKQQQDWEKSLIAGVIGAGALVCIWWVAGVVGRVRRRRQNRTARAEGERLAIYVAELTGDDANGSARAVVVNTIRHELGRGTVEVNPAGIQLAPRPSLNETDNAIAIARQARAFLRRHNGDLLIWGARRRLNQTDTIELRFISATDEHGRDQPFTLTDHLLLEADFAPEMGAALAAIAAALAAPAIDESGTYLAGRLIPILDRLAPLAHNSRQVLRSEDRGLVLASYALLSAVIGGQSGNATRLEQSVAAYRDALKEWTRERVPLQWAGTQNNLGNALSKLGQRESGTDRLLEAVAAYRDALKEWTRERVPLQWATTQNNLGNALSTLGQRESGTARLEKAMAAWEACLTLTVSVWPTEWIDEVRSNCDKARSEIARRATALT